MTRKRKKKTGRRTFIIRKIRASFGRLYEEYSLIKSTAENAVREDDLKIIMYKNNLYPDYYPINFEMSDKTVKWNIWTYEFKYKK